MGSLGLMAGLAAACAALVAIKVLEHRLPRQVYQAGLVTGLSVPVAGSLYALWRLGQAPIGAREIALFLGLYVLSGLGTTLGWHRLLTHRSFETYPVVRLAFLVLGAMANQGRPIDWAANHLKHHANADREGDPHSPLDGFFHAHVAWVVTAPPAERARYCPHLRDDPIVVFVDRTAPLWVGLGLLVPYLLDGWNGLLWGGIVRATVGNHVVFAVNSICHVYGAQPFDTRDESRNNWWMALLALGEGWHNNHHAFPSMASHGMTAGEIDLTGAVIRLLARLGLAWGVKQPAPALVERRRRVAPHPLPPPPRRGEGTLAADGAGLAAPASPPRPLAISDGEGESERARAPISPSPSPMERGPGGEALPRIRRGPNSIDPSPLRGGGGRGWGETRQPARRRR